MKLKDVILIILNITLAVIILWLYFRNKSKFGDNFDDRINKLTGDTYNFIKTTWPTTTITQNEVTAEHVSIYLSSLLNDVILTDPDYKSKEQKIISDFFSGLPVKIITIIADTYIYQVGVSAAIRKMIVKQVQSDGGWVQENIDNLISNLYRGTTDLDKGRTAFNNSKMGLEFIYTMYRSGLLAKYYNQVSQTITSYFKNQNPESSALDLEVGNTAPEEDAFFDAQFKTDAEIYAETLTDFIGEDASELTAEAIESVATALDEAAAAEGGVNPFVDISALLLDIAVGIDIVGTFIQSTWQYCPCDAPKLVDQVLPVCYKGTCSEEFGGNYTETTQGLCAIDCRKKHGSCYYNNGSWCANRGIARCWSKTAAYPNDTQARYSEPAQITESRCNWDPNNLSNACKLGYSNVCKDLRTNVSINDIYQVLKNENLIY
jgi:hypothetical protein